MKLTPLLPFLLLSIFFSSCNKDDENYDEYIFDARGTEHQCVDATNIFFNDENNIFSYTCHEDWVEFFFDIVGDESDEVDGVWPQTDTYRIYVDQDKNGMVDDGVDFLISKSNAGNLCRFFLVSPTSTYPCSSLPQAFEELKFSETENSSTKHFNIKLTMPKHRISSTAKANLVVHIYDPTKGWQKFPSEGTLFSDVFEIEF